jgi:hypothetical protein
VSRQADGTYACDRCGTDIGNGGIDEAAAVSDLELDADGNVVLGAIRVLHLCRKNKCVRHVMTRRALRALVEKKENAK